jgi:hypothetical protein
MIKLLLNIYGYNIKGGNQQQEKEEKKGASDLRDNKHVEELPINMHDLHTLIGNYYQDLYRVRDMIRLFSKEREALVEQAELKMDH